jgi:transposase
MAQITVGVDVGKDTHRAAAYDPATSRTVGQLSFGVDRAGFARFEAFLERLAPAPDAVLVGLEASGHYHRTLLGFLTERGHRVALINPWQATQFRRSQGKKAKTDRIDARALARFAAVSAPAPATAPDPEIESLRELTRFRAELVRDRTAALNRLHAAVDLAFPELTTVLGNLASRTALTVLDAYPTAATIAAADRAELERLVGAASQGQIGPARVEALVRAARASVAARSVATALAAKVRVLARQVAALDREVADLEDAIEAGFARLGHRPEHFPVGGAVSLATILSEVGDVRRFPSAKHFLSHFGWCPADTQSGQFKDAHPRLARAGNRYVRRVVWMLAVGAVRHPGPYREYFLRRTVAGKNKMDTLVAIGRKVLTTMYAILKTGRAYDPGYQQQARPPLAARIPA